ncbi:RNA 2',3'-cyclic phosphodiesterase [Bacillus sp. KH172YL63]|uniref:RNA 2',3'-cyclic phosphodiesterase n=1 Tax=Bacillus sp. KH172YL63 TaxID=2709784 RepID=UPI0013E4C43E|nr:RNA 2',3'-cyclic phosphodiesterase [Bacillus sp. KH172YL63]BCB05324.1 RNA 2',3'-cyclic phosphodiesterase [Bacillus sp. KH172YL63]
MSNPHYFFALSLPKETKRWINEQVQPLQAAGALKKWVHPEDYHLTLAFLGSAGDLGPVVEKVGDVYRPAFRLTLNGFGTFGKSDQPRIFWMGAEDSAQLQHLRDRVYDSCEEEGYVLDKRPFSPHITVGRKWAGLKPFTHEWLEPFLPETSHSFMPQSIVLYQTHLDRLPKYEALYTFPLQQIDRHERNDPYGTAD